MKEFCLFTKIIHREIPAEIVFENSRVLAFRDIHPQAKVHILFIHKEKTENLNQLIQRPGQIEDLFQAIREYTEKEGLDSKGFRIVVNTGPDAGQTVFYTHLHLLAGDKLKGFGKGP